VLEEFSTLRCRALQIKTVSCIQIEPDFQLLVQAINRDEADRGASDVLFKEIKESIFLNFICFQVSFCPRACKLCGGSQAVCPDLQLLDRSL
jgi:hypothetical protein